MITALNVARVAKLIALLGFVFPWVLVSCSGEPIARVTGIDLATGGLTAHDSGGLHPNLWVMLALAAVIAGIVASLLVRGRQAILTVFAAAVVALVASAIGVANVASSAPVEPQGSADALGAAHLQYGYFITVAGLLVAIGASGLALAGRQGGSGDATGPP
jgi:hypothetical protein